MYDTYRLQIDINGNLLECYKACIIGNDSIMVTKPNTAGLLIKDGHEKDSNRKKYEGRSRKMRSKSANDQAQVDQEKAFFNDIESSAVANPDLYVDHILFKFPTDIGHVEANKGNEDEINVANDIVFWHREQKVSQNNGIQLDLSSTTYIMTLHVAIEGTMKSIEKPSVDTSVGALSQLCGNLNIAASP